MSRKLIGMTGPSYFTEHCIGMCEKFFKANFVLLYQSDCENLVEWVERCDGVILAGGVDLHPSIYGEQVYTDKGLSKFDVQRDIRELFLLDRCFATKKPLLGICRGHQILAVYKGLLKDFIMDLSGNVCHQPHKYNISVSPKEPTHSITLRNLELFNVENPKERKIIAKTIHEDVEEKKAWINSFHHQGIKYLTPRSNIDTYYSDKDVAVFATAPTGLEKIPYVIEGMTGIEKSHWLSVQWHPEFDYEDNTASRIILEQFSKLMEG